MAALQWGLIESVAPNYDLTMTAVRIAVPGDSIWWSILPTKLLASKMSLFRSNQETLPPDTQSSLR